MNTKNILFIGLVVALFFAVATIIFAAGCCLETNTGEYCINTNEGCKSGMYVSSECEQESLCANKGSCIKDGVCQDGVSEIKCSNGEFGVDKKCNEIEGYKDICCLLSSGGMGGYMFMQQNKCDSLGGSVEEGVSNWIDCSDLNKDPDFRLGCCVEDGKCSYGLVENCNGDFQGYYCSKLETQCNPVCNSKSYKARGKFGDQVNDLYWFDSCDNQEDLAEDCDSLKEVPKQNENGGWICSDATCKSEDLWDNSYTDENFDGDFNNDAATNTKFNGRNYRVNGESWCEYQQQKVGPGLDLSGTKHYRHYCDSGEERVDPGSSDGRDEICIESKVNTEIGEISSARWLLNEPETCVKCNREDDVSGCCSSAYSGGNGCAYIDRKDVANDGKIDLFFNSASYEAVQDIIDGEYEIDNYPDFNVENAKLMYYKNEELIHESKNIRSGGVFTLEGGDKDCDSDDCRVTIGDLPEPGTYEVKLYVSGYFCWAWNPFDGCLIEDDDEFLSYLGEFAVNPPKGICVPLVPSSTDSNCDKLFSAVNPLLNENQIKPFYELNYYYNFPFSTFGVASGCKDTEECRQEFISNYNSEASSLLVTDDMNRLCRSLGDCGASPSFGGEITTAGYASTDVCTVVGGCKNERNISEKFSSVLSGQYANLNNDIGSRPENFVPILFLVPFAIRRKFKGKFLFGVLLFAILFLAACATGDRPGLGLLNGDRTTIECRQWQKPIGGDDCWRCSATEDAVKDGKHGLLPKNNVDQLDGKPAYRCTKYMCESLGSICKYATGLAEGEPICTADVPDYTVPKSMIVNATYTCNTFEPSGCEVGNYEIKANGNSLFIKGKLEPLTTIDINFKTVDVNDPNRNIITTCEYSNNVNMEDAVPLPYPDGGGENTKHSLRITNQAPKEDNYKYYVRCTTQHGKSSVSPFMNVEFNVGREGYTKPLIESITPAEAYAKYGSSVKQANLFVRGDVVGCRWDNRRVNYNEMGTREKPDETKNIGDGVYYNEKEGDSGKVYDSVGIINVDWDRNFVCSDSSGGFSDSHVCGALLQGINEGVNRFWFSCPGQDGTATEAWPENDDGYIVVGTEPLNITNIKCRHSLGEDCGTIYDSKFDFSIDTVGGAKGGEAGCEWALGSYDFDVFDEPGGIFEPEFAKTHTEKDFSSETGEINIKFRCKDVADNVAEKSVAVNIQKDETPPKLTKVYKNGGRLNIVTDEVTSCYYIAEKSTDFKDKSEFETDDGLEHSIDMSEGNNFYRIRCEDKFGNYRQTDVYVNRL